MYRKTLVRPFFATSVSVVLLALLSTVSMQGQETSRVIPFNNVSTTLPPGGPQDVTVQVWDAAAAGTLVFSEAQPGLAVDASGNISFVLGSRTPGPPAGLDPNNFPTGSSRYVDVVDATNTSVLTNGRLPLNAVAFSISPGPQGPAGPKGDKGDTGSQGQQGPPGVVQAVSPGDGSIVIGGSVGNPTVAVAPNGIGNANIADGGLSPSKINGTVATLGMNTYTGNQIINANLGVGTANPLTKLDVRGHFVLDPSVSPILYTSSTVGEQNRYLQLVNSPSTPSASGLKAGGVLVADSFDFASPDKNTLIVKGSVGIGTAFPHSRLDIAAQDGLTIAGFQPFLTLRDTNTVPPCPTCPHPAGFIQSVAGGLDFVPNSFQGSGAAMVIADGSGNVGIGIGTPTSAKLVVIDPNIGTGVFGQSAAGSGVFGRSTNANGWGVYGDNTAGGWAGYFAGKVRVGVLTIAGGADLAEKFEVSAPATATAETKNSIQPGMVVSIDPAHPGRLVLSTKAYDRRAAGVISGAGGVNPGMLMAQSGSAADGDQPVAMIGRVYCWADASYGAIQPGDLLTSSNTPGHAMKMSDHRKGQGAIIGKAMTGLNQGKGLVLVLVSLQ